MLHIHRLEKIKHADFLSENRIDPISLDAIAANNEVVICASCKSVFLLSSWEYIGKSHCGQNETLKELPQTQNIVVSQKEEDFEKIKTHSVAATRKTETTEENTLSFDVFAFVGSAFGCIYFIYLLDHNINFGTLLSLGIFAPFIYIILIWIKSSFLNFFSFLKNEIMKLLN
ncbi:hypothetical protein [Bernardetia sp.]|uniref:hypothetical protein n=1 Tax=Bernardetia sp. TaxID=1937974 RepID=UPI0025BF9DCF|nr:hypothetical protein [Bernardetia sp.]